MPRKISWPLLWYVLLSQADGASSYPWFASQKPVAAFLTLVMGIVTPPLRAIC